MIAKEGWEELEKGRFEICGKSGRVKEKGKINVDDEFKKI